MYKNFRKPIDPVLFSNYNQPKPKNYPYRKISILLLIGVLIIFFAVRKFNKEDILGMVVDAQPPPAPTAIDPNFEKQMRECFIPTAAVYGYTLRVTSGFRTLEEQKLLYDQGREVDGHIVTYTVISLHNFGFAEDVVDRFRGYDINWEKLGRIGAYCGLEQGDEEYDEEAHFQHREGLSIDDFIAGKRPSILQLPCPIMDTRAQSDEPLTLIDLKACGAPNF